VRSPCVFSNVAERLQQVPRRASTEFFAPTVDSTVARQEGGDAAAVAVQDLQRETGTVEAFRGLVFPEPAKVCRSHVRVSADVSLVTAALERNLSRHSAKLVKLAVFGKADPGA